MYSLDIGIIKDWSGTWIETLLYVMNYFTDPLREWVFDSPWIPEHSLLGQILHGLLDTFLGPFLNFSLFEVLIGGGLIVYLLYQLVIWILNLVT